MTEVPEGGEPRPRRRSRGWSYAFGPGGWFRRLAKLWGFLGFAIFVLVMARSVVLPFVFALLIAYILAPLVRRMSMSEDGTRRLPRGLAIIICYIVLLAAMALFGLALMPRISQDLARVAGEAPALYDKVNTTYAPRVAHWLERRFPSLAPPEEPVEPVDPDLPPRTGVVLQTLPDGRIAVQLPETGVEIEPRPGGGYIIAPPSEEPPDVGLEDKLRRYAGKMIAQMQGEVGSLFRAGQAFVAKVVRSIFVFFLVLMIAAFILLDIQKIHGFVRSLIPEAYRHDYDIIVAGVDRGLAGVIRGQLMICLVNGVLTYIGLVIFDVKYSLILAVVASVLSLIPIFGSILSTIPIVLAALVSGAEGIDITRALAMVAWIVGIHFLEANFLNPKIIGSAAKIHPVLVIFALVLGESSYGLTGALLAVPILSIVQVMFVYFRNKAWKAEMPPRQLPENAQ